MTNQERMAGLVKELGGFVRSENQAIREENWDFFVEVSKKKEGHLKKVVELSASVDLEEGGLRDQLQRIQQAQQFNAELLREGIKDDKEKLEKLDAARAKLTQVRSYVDKQRKEKKQRKAGSLDASA